MGVRCGVDAGRKGRRRKELQVSDTEVVVYQFGCLGTLGGMGACGHFLACMNHVH